jgi:2-(1,2-epoxy-1,2-dihydrophenyl)acetyl-CoA isomerase
MGYDFILYHKADGVATITMNRPERLNALNVQIGVEMLDALEDAEHDEAIRVLVLTGAGRGFCAGDDMKGMADPGKPRKRSTDPSTRYVYGEGRWTTIVRNMTRMPKPVVGVINGHAHGAGFNLALGCDFRIVSESATLAAPFVKWAMATGTNRLQYFVGIGKALEWTMLGTALSAREAERWGLATMVVPPDELGSAAAAFVERLKNAPTASLGFTKLAVYRGWDRDADASYELQGLAQHFARQSEDYAEGRKAFAEKRAPAYTGKIPDILRIEGG